MSDVILRLTDVSKSFYLDRGRKLDAISRVNMEARRNEICVILGPSCCGKSTALRMIAGLETPTSGGLVLEGRSIEGPGRDRGMVFQAYTSFDWLSMRRNVEFGMKIIGVPAGFRVERAETADTTIVMVTHDIGEAIFLADKIVFMSRHPGRVKTEIVPDFKAGKRIAEKERVIELDGYSEIERQIMRLMRG